MLQQMLLVLVLGWTAWPTSSGSHEIRGLMGWQILRSCGMQTVRCYRRTVWPAAQTARSLNQQWRERPTTNCTCKRASDNGITIPRAPRRLVTGVRRWRHLRLAQSNGHGLTVLSINQQVVFPVLYSALRHVWGVNLDLPFDQLVIHWQGWWLKQDITHRHYCHVTALMKINNDTRHLRFVRQGHSSHAVTGLCAICKYSANGHRPTPSLTNKL